MTAPPNAPSPLRHEAAARQIGLTSAPRPDFSRASSLTEDERRAFCDGLSEAWAHAQAREPDPDASVWILLRLFRRHVTLEVSDAVQTACMQTVVPGDHGVMTIGAGFWRELLQDPQDLLFLILHELLHLVRDPTPLGDLPAHERALRNIVTDAINNALLLGPGFEGLFDPLSVLPSRTCRASGPLPGLLLTAGCAASLYPHLGLDAGVQQLWARHVEPPPTPGRAPYQPMAWARLHTAYLRHGADGTLTSGVARKLLDPLLPQIPDATLLHLALSRLQAEAATRVPPWLRSAAAALKARIQGSARGAGRGEGETRAAGALSTERSRPHRDSSRNLGDATQGMDHAARNETNRVGRELLRFAMRWAQEPHPDGLHHEGTRGRTLEPAESGARIRSREALLYACGVKGTPFARQVQGVGTCGLRMPVYLDVSGSMNAALPVLLSAIHRAAPWFGQPVAVFADRVVACDPRQILGRGRHTGHGTNFDAVVQHLLSLRLRDTCALVITDGDGKALEPSLLQQLRSSRISVALVLTDGPRPDNPWAPLTPRSGVYLLNL